MTVNESEGAGAGIELDKEYFAVNWNSPLDANGARVPTELVSHPDNVANFVQSGITSTNEISVSNNTDVMNYRIGISKYVKQRDSTECHGVENGAHGVARIADLGRNTSTVPGRVSRYGPPMRSMQ